MKETFSQRLQCAAEAITKVEAHHFFGGLDRNPWSASGRHLLAMRVEFRNNPEQREDVAKVGLIDLANDSHFCEVGETTMWNWRYGAWTQWIQDRPEQMVYNTVLDGRPGAAVVRVEQSQWYSLPCPVYCVAPTGARGLSVNFGRLHHYRPGEGYSMTAPEKPPEAAPADDGIWLVDIRNANKRLVLSFADLQEWTGATGKDVEGTYVDRLAFNREGTRFGFLHHTVYRGHRRHTQLITSSPTGSALFCVTKGLISSFAWGPGGKLVAWCGPKEGPGVTRSGPGRLMRMAGAASRGMGQPDWMEEHLLGPLRTRMMGQRYRLFREDEGEIGSVPDSVVEREGEPVLSRDGQWLLAGSRADADHAREIQLLNLSSGRMWILGRFAAADGTRRELQGDLHPRFRPDGKALCFESCHEGSRQIYRMDIPESVLEGKEDASTSPASEKILAS